MVGLIEWGTKGGGYFGVEEGTYAFQNAEVNVGWQALGLVVCIVVGLVTAWVLAAILERTIGLREDEETIVEGFDLRQWEIVHDIEQQPVVEAAAGSEPAAVASGRRGNGAESAGSGFETRAP
jgi:ammonia channel protein AmtB